MERRWREDPARRRRSRDTAAMPRKRKKERMNNMMMGLRNKEKTIGFGLRGGDGLSA